MTSGRLFLVGTPIGNLGDISFRAVETLRSVDLIACEDTRRTRALLTRYDIHRRLVSYHDFNEARRAAELVGRLKRGLDVALVSDAGMPGIADPGYDIVQMALREGIKVEVIPGPSAILSALVISGLATDAFTFVGFLPKTRARRRTFLLDRMDERATLVCFEVGSRLAASLADCVDVLGERRAAIARELTKLHEEVLRGSLSELADAVRRKPPRGEYVVVIAGAADRRTATEGADLADDVEALVERFGVKRTEAIKHVAALRGVDRHELSRGIFRGKRRSARGRADD